MNGLDTCHHLWEPKRGPVRFTLNGNTYQGPGQACQICGEIRECGEIENRGPDRHYICILPFGHLEYGPRPPIHCEEWYDMDFKTSTQWTDAEYLKAIERGSRL